MVSGLGLVLGLVFVVPIEWINHNLKSFEDFGHYCREVLVWVCMFVLFDAG